MLAVIAAGCHGGAKRPVAAPLTDGPPIGLQLIEKDPMLKGRRFNGLMHFESSSDAAFVSTHPNARIVKDHAHTGRGALMLSPGTRRVTLKVLNAAGGDFAGDWPLVGPYLRSKESIDVTVGYDLRSGRRLLQRRVKLREGEWVSAALDVAALNPNRNAGDGVLVLDFDRPLAAPVWVDDVLLVNNTETLLDTGRNGWTIRRRGHRISIDRALSFNLGLTTAEGSADGWTVEEVNPLRARFSSPGPTKAITVYYDGRAMWDVQYRGLSVITRDDKTLAAAHATPADVSVPAELGKVDRNTDGDRDNDGFNETTGAYRVSASGPRVEVTLSPRAAPITRPVLQIGGLPGGKVLVTMDGQLIDRSLRLDSGDVLVELPSRVVRTTTVSASVRVE